MMVNIVGKAWLENAENIIGQSCQKNYFIKIGEIISRTVLGPEERGRRGGQG